MLKRLGRRLRLVLGMATLIVLLGVTAGLWLKPPSARIAWTTPARCEMILVSHHGNALVAVQTAEVSLWDTTTGQKKASLPRPAKTQIGLIALSPDGQFVVYREVPNHLPTNLPSRISLWNTTGAAEPSLLTDSPCGVKVTADGSRMLLSPYGVTHPVAVSTRPLARQQLWNLAAGEALAWPAIELESVTSLALMADGRLFGLAMDEHHTRAIWDIAARRKCLSIPDALLVSLQFSGDGQRCASHHRDEIKIWDLATGNLVSTFIGGEGNLLLAMTADGSRVLTLSGDYQLWDARSNPGRRIASIPYSPGDFSNSYRLSTDGRWLAVEAPRDWSVMSQRWDVWATATGTRQLALDVWGSPPILSPDSRTVVCLLPDSSPPRLMDQVLNQPRNAPGIILWNLETGRPLTTFDDAHTVGYSGDGRSLALSHENGTIEFWDIPPRRAWYIDYGLPVVFALLVLLGVQMMWHAGRKQPPQAPTSC